MKSGIVETVGLRELSNAISSFVRKASLGVRVLITDRGRVIAEIGRADFSAKQDGHPLLLEWESSGKLRRGSGKRPKFPRGPRLMPGTDAQALLDDLKGRAVTPVYLETSAFLRVIFRQPSYLELAEFLEGDHILIVTSVVTLLESRRALARALFEGLINEGEAQVLLGTVAEHESAWQIIEVTDEVQIRVGRTFPAEPVRTLDAIHLASALEFKKIYADLRVCSLDERVSKNLPLLGLADWRSAL